MSWSPLVLAADVPAITNYLISWGTDLENGEDLRTTSVSVPTTSYVISELRPETAYQIAVAGVNRVGIGNRSTLTIQTDQAEPPSAPQALRPANVRTNTLVVRWGRPNFDGGDPVTTYTISWADTSVSDASTTVSIAASENDYKITGLLPNRLYYIVVTAANSRGSGVPSTPLEARTLGLTGVGAQAMEAQAIAAGISHTCVLTNGAMKCWGFNRYGQLGDATEVDSKIRVQVDGLTMNVVAIAAGSLHTCAIVNGAAKCWGLNDFGQLGNGLSGSVEGDITHSSSTPKKSWVCLWMSRRLRQENITHVLSRPVRLSVGDGMILANWVTACQVVATETVLRIAARLNPSSV